MKVKDICNVLEEFAPLEIQEAYDNCGLQIGDCEWEVGGVLLATDLTEDVVAEAKRKGCGMIVVHHPLIFGGLKKIVGKTYVERLVVDCIKNDIAVYAAHTNFDKVENGVSYRMAEKLSMRNVEMLVETSAGSGLGCVGDMDEEMEIEEFFDRLKEVFGVAVVRHSRKLNGKVKRVAVCGGSGSEFIGNAIESGADVYVTADVRYHEFFGAEDRIVVADIGHFESEKFTKEIFYEQVREFFPNFALYLSEEDRSPIFWH